MKQITVDIYLHFPYQQNEDIAIAELLSNVWLRSA